MREGGKTGREADDQKRILRGEKRVLLNTFLQGGELNWVPGEKRGVRNLYGLLRGESWGIFFKPVLRGVQMIGGSLKKKNLLLRGGKI